MKKRKKIFPSVFGKVALFTCMQTDSWPVAAFVREPADVYRAKRDRYLTSHQLIDYAACPYQYKRKCAGLVAERDWESFLVGSATHTLTLEGPAEFERSYAVGGPINEKTGKPYGSETKAFAEWAREQGKPCLSNGQFEQVSCMAAAVKSHELAAGLLADGLPEGVMRATYGGVECQIRCDWFNPREGLSDLKTCADITNFIRYRVLIFGDGGERIELDPDCDFAAYHYGEQLAFYRTIYRIAAGKSPPVYVIAVEKEPPYRCGVWQINEPRLRYYETLNDSHLAAFKRSRETNTWPTGYEDLRVIE